jgi:lysophospholipase L1-like esterase
MTRRGIIATASVAVLGAAAVAGIVVVAVMAAGAATADAGAAERTAASATTAPSASPTASAPSASGTRPSSVVTIGDSITAGLGLDGSQAWPALIAAEDGIAVRNLGCSGAGFVATGSCGFDFAGLVAQASADDPDLVIIESSDNDFGQSDDDIAEATWRTVTALHAALPSATIVGLSTLWDQPGGTPAQVASTSAALENAITAVGGVYLDIGQPLRDDPDDLLQSDDEHPTASGQEVLGRTVRAALSSAGITI